MCKLCALAVRYPRARQDSLVFDLSQFATTIAAESSIEQLKNQSNLSTQEKSS